MSVFHVTGGHRLSGVVTVQGAKNSVLPILAATLLTSGKSEIHNCPLLADVTVAEDILRYLGCNVSHENGVVCVDSTTVTRWDIPEKLMRRMRSSVMFLGPILARCGKAVVFPPGGCQLGARPIDLHLSALEAMGTSVAVEDGKILCTAAKLHGTDIQLNFPSVGATENIMMAAAAAEGRTRIIGAAREPEIEDLQDFLRRLGVEISGAGSSVITIEGAAKKKEVSFAVMPDRIATVTYLVAAACTGGKIFLPNAHAEHIKAVLDVLEDAGCELCYKNGGIDLNTNGKRLFATQSIKTAPYPGFPTDAQPLLMAAMVTAFGTTVFVENIFESRFRHVDELIKMGANIKTFDRVAAMTGVPELYGAEVSATDLRGGAALVLAALSAQGESRIFGGEYINRGYEEFADRLCSLGAEVLETGG